MNLEGVVSVITAGGSSIVLVALITGLFKLITGRASRERADNASAESQRVVAVEERKAANARADVAESNSRHFREYIVRLRRQILELGHEPISDPNPPTSES